MDQYSQIVLSGPPVFDLLYLLICGLVAKEAIPYIFCAYLFN